MENSKIEWTDHTFNPWWGCLKVSPGCAHCYADSQAKRYGFDIWGPAATTDRRTFGDTHWAQPGKWNKAAERAGRRARVFCASMADVFENHPTANAQRPRLWDVIRATPNLDWLLLTKRPQNIAQMLPTDWGQGWANVWLGTSVEDQQRADERIPVLLSVPAPVRFLSCEPLLGPVEMRPEWVLPRFAADDPRYYAAGGRGVDWVIVGGESGPGARPMSSAWARGLRDQLTKYGVAYFFKQWGEWVGGEFIPEDDVSPLRGYYSVQGFAAWHRSSGFTPMNNLWASGAVHTFDDQHFAIRVGKKKAWRMLDGRTWDELPTPAIWEK